MDDLLRQSEQQARNAGPEGGTRPDLDAFVQPLGAQWTPNEPLGADAELGRSLDKVLQQLEWLQCQRQANALDTQQVQDSLLQLNELDPSQGLSTSQSKQATHQPKVLLVLHTGVSNWQELANDLPSSTDLLLLEQHSSGLQQISDSLSRRQAHQAYDGLMLLLPQAIDGVLAFGSDQLSLETLQLHRDQLALWGQGLSDGAQINLLTGHGSEALDALLDELAAITQTGASISAAPQAELPPVGSESQATASSVSIGAAAPELLQEARRELKQASNDNRLPAALEAAYGADSAEQIAPLVQRFLNQELEPRLHRARIDAASIDGAFVASHNLILVDQDLEATPLSQKAVVLEELGHWFEQLAGVVDSSGDEGQRFALALLGDGITRRGGDGDDDDHAWISLNGQRVRVEQSSNTAPSLSAVFTLTGGTEDTPLEISHATLLQASDASDADGDDLQFLIAAVSSGSLEKWDGAAWVAVTPGSTLLASGETLRWTPAADATGELNAFTVKAYDGALASESAIQVTVDVAAANQAPAVSGTSKTTTQGGTLSFSSSDFSLTDPDSQVGAANGYGKSLQTIKITAVSANGELWLDRDGTREVLGADDEVNVADLARLRFSPDGSFSGDTSFSWDGSDGIAYSGSPATTTISITPLSDRSPLFSTSSGRTLVVRPGSGNAIDTPVLVDPGLRLLDPEAATTNQSAYDTISSATVTLVEQSSGAFISGDVLSATASDAIAVSYDSSSGVLSLSGEASAADYETVLRSLSFSSSDTTNNNQRSLNLAITSSYANDGGVLQLDGSDDYIETLRPAIPMAGDWTVTVWAQADAAVTANTSDSFTVLAQGGGISGESFTLKKLGPATSP